MNQMRPNKGIFMLGWRKRGRRGVTVEESVRSQVLPPMRSIQSVGAERERSGKGSGAVKVSSEWEWSGEWK